MERDYLAENVAYLTKDLGKCNISQKICSSGLRN